MGSLPESNHQQEKHLPAYSALDSARFQGFSTILAILCLSQPCNGDPFGIGKLADETNDKHIHRLNNHDACVLPVRWRAWIDVEFCDLPITGLRHSAPPQGVPRAPVATPAPVCPTKPEWAVLSVTQRN